MISLINYDFQWGRSEVVIIYPDWSQTELLTVQDASRPTPGYPGIHPDLSARIVAHDGRPQAERRHGRCHGVRAMKFSLFPGKSGEHELKSMEKWSFASQLVFFPLTMEIEIWTTFIECQWLIFQGTWKHVSSRRKSIVLVNWANSAIAFFLIIGMGPPISDPNSDTNLILRLSEYVYSAYPIVSMVLLYNLYMVTWIPSIYPLYVSIYQHHGWVNRVWIWAPHFDPSEFLSFLSRFRHLPSSDRMLPRWSSFAGLMTSVTIGDPTSWRPMVDDVASGKHTKNYGKSPCY